MITSFQDSEKREAKKVLQENLALAMLMSYCKGYFLCQNFRCSQNIRAAEDQMKFATWLLQLGNGTVTAELLPETNVSEDDIKIYIAVMGKHVF